VKRRLHFIKHAAKLKHHRGDTRQPQRLHLRQTQGGVRKSGCDDSVVESVLPKPVGLVFQHAHEQNFEGPLRAAIVPMFADPRT